MIWKGNDLNMNKKIKNELKFKLQSKAKTMSTVKLIDGKHKCMKAVPVKEIFRTIDNFSDKEQEEILKKWDRIQELCNLYKTTSEYECNDEAAVLFAHNVLDIVKGNPLQKKLETENNVFYTKGTLCPVAVNGFLNMRGLQEQAKQMTPEKEQAILTRNEALREVPYREREQWLKDNPLESFMENELDEMER